MKVFSRITQALRVRFLPIKTFIRIEFKKQTGYKLNLRNPRTFNEKMQWLKLNYKDPTYTTMADKVGAKDLIRKKVGKEYVIPTIRVYNRAEDIFLKDLPESFALKASHGSGWNIIHTDKSNADEKQIQKYFHFFLKKSYYQSSKEWAYKNIKPRVICEELIFEKNGDLPKDIKFFCFHGKPQYIQIDQDRFTGHTRCFYDVEWKKQSFTYGDHPLTKEILEKPENFEKMLQVATKLSTGYPFLRVDLYNINGQILAGELTCYPGNGMLRFTDWQSDKKLGDLLHLDYIEKRTGF